ncbi:uncharacterized protein [Malus domestica]|uniref:uncharacterized protein n=1 Tax=Malus domestica TaxID=3750 RepID=UPI0039762787
MLDASAGGALVDKTPIAAKTLIANHALNAQPYEGVGQREPPRQQPQVNEVVDGSKMQSAAICGVCSRQGHLNDQCPQLIENGGWETAHAMGYQGPNQPRNDPYSNTYNTGWRDHPNFKWREPQQPTQQGGFRQPPPVMFPRPYTPPQPPPQSAQTNSGTSLDNDTLLTLLTSLTQSQQSQAKEMNEVKKQIGQMAKFMGQKEDEKLQFKEEEQDKATTRKETILPQLPTLPNPSNPFTTGKKGSNSVNSNLIPPNVPFPHRFMQSNKEESDKDILETFRKVQVNIPLLDAIKQVPKYAKFLKELCTTRKKISNKEVVRVGENVSVVLQRKLPPKCKDLGSFTIPCVIGSTRFEHAMLDLGASINVMPYSIYASMNLGELKNDEVIIQLADRTNAYPKGVLEDVLVQVNHLIFPADFYVLEIEDSTHSSSLPILLGKPFMKTACTKIDVFKGMLSMEFDGEEYLEDLNEDALEMAITKGVGLENEGEGDVHAHGKEGNNLAVPFNEELAEVTTTLESIPKHVGDHETLTVIISSSLTAQEEEKLVRVLREYKIAIRWSLADIKGYN